MTKVIVDLEGLGGIWCAGSGPSLSQLPGPEVGHGRVATLLRVQVAESNRSPETGLGEAGAGRQLPISIKAITRPRRYLRLESERKCGRVVAHGVEGRTGL